MEVAVQMRINQVGLRVSEIIQEEVGSRPYSEYGSNNRSRGFYDMQHEDNTLDDYYNPYEYLSDLPNWSESVNQLYILKSINRWQLVWKILQGVYNIAPLIL